MSKKIGRFLVLFIFVAIGCFGISALSTPHAFAMPLTGSCGNSDGSCSGQDPVATNCADNTVHVATNSWADQSGNGGTDTVNDVWSNDPLCQTNWPQSIIWGDNGLFSNSYDVLVKRDAGGGLGNRVVDGGFVSDCGDGCWGNMVYAPTQLTQACIIGTSNHLNGTKCAAQSGFVPF